MYIEPVSGGTKYFTGSYPDLATVQNAVRIIVLDHGKIMESGTHNELMQHNGLYKTLFEIQFKNLVA